jgi:hypothetical protein
MGAAVLFISPNSQVSRFALFEMLPFEFFVIGVYAFVFLFTCWRGFSAKVSLFEMGDVGLLFTAPLSALSILVFGFLRQMGVTLLGGFALLFQFTLLRAVYTVSALQIVLAVLGYLVVVVLAQAAALGLFMLRIGHSDYYEDVLQATENRAAMIAAHREGTQRQSIKRKVRLGKTGIDSGERASVIFFKNRLEARRSSVFLLDAPTLFRVVLSVAVAFFLRDSAWTMVLAVLMFLQVTGGPVGRWSEDLRRPFVYLIPAQPFKKLLALFGEGLLQSLVEALLVMIPVGLLLGASPLELAMLFGFRFSCALAFMAATVVAKRFFGAGADIRLDLIVNLASSVLMVAPGIVLGLVLQAVFGTSVALLSILVWNLAAGLVATYLGRGVLVEAEV